MSTQYSSYQSASSSTANLADAVVETVVRWPMRMTGATVDLMLRGMQRMTGGSSLTSRTNGSSMTFDATSRTTSSPSSGPTANTGWSSMFSSQNSGTFDQDLSGDDLKYVIWSIVFTKPGHECILQKQQEELVNYSADSSTYAAVKIAKFLDSARYGHSPKPESWGAHYPGEAARSSGSGERSANEPGKGENSKGWRIPPEDQKYVCFLYHVDRRLPKQEEHTRVERVTIERDTRVV